jgi:predicted enzyme related to lactoylglutathione lyase
MNGIIMSKKTTKKSTTSSSQPRANEMKPKLQILEKIPFVHPSPETPAVYISVGVSNYARAIKFYQDIFHFEKKWDYGEEVGWCELELPVIGVRIGLNLMRNQPVVSGTTTIGLNVSDLEGTKRYLDAKKVKTSEIVDLPGLVSMFDMWDSEGNVLQILGEARIKQK